jgi:CAAX protease family protein
MNSTDQNSQIIKRYKRPFTSAVFPVWFLLLAAPMLEELAWHSYGTDCLRSRFNLFNASLLFAIFWAFWHFPLSFIKDYYHSNLLEIFCTHPMSKVIQTGLLLIVSFYLVINDKELFFKRI